jgi:putative ABC transport system permease protein
LVLSKKLAEILHVSPGDSLRLRALTGQRLTREVPVMATVDTYLGLSAYADIHYLNRLIGESWSSNALLAASYQQTPTTGFLKELTRRPTVVGIGERTRSLTQLDETFGKSMGTMISIMVFFAGLIAFGSVLNAALVSLSEREREVGTLRVIGYSPAQVWMIFFGESYLLNGLGILLGSAGGVGLAYALAAAYSTELYRFPAVIYFSRILLSAVLMTLFIGIAQLIVYRLIRGFAWLSVLAIKE